ncbi:MAG: hypothetical protein WDN75_05160 [Bacteroidota bacterium]
MTTETTVATASLSIVGFGIQSTRTNVTTTIEGQEPVTVQGAREVNFTNAFSSGGVVPYKNVSNSAGTSLFSLGVGGKIDVNVNP